MAKINGGFDVQSLESLNSVDQLRLLDVVDKLRAQGLGSFIALPQLIVCGDQSSGKSSVLAALSDLPFPRKENLCTRFATEVILRRSDQLAISVSIVPGGNRDTATQERLREFRQTISSKDGFEAIFQEAQTEMDLSPTGNAFYEDILRIEISGPKHPQLTIVDLPGLIHSESKKQTSEDIKLVSQLVRSYMSNSRSIILAVVSAKNDHANQAVLQRARAVDPEGYRTLGIITKPDTLRAGSVSEAAFLTLARNEDIKLNLGWHIVKNLDESQSSIDLGTRDEDEELFFKESNFKTLPPRNLGIANLRNRLSKVLFDQIRRELPALIRDIEQGTTEYQNMLDHLGVPRETPEAQRMFLMELSERFQDICRSAIDGTYEKQFFGEGLTDSESEKRLRAVVRNLEMDFANDIRTKGARWTITSDTKLAKLSGYLTREQAVRNILQLLKSSRGLELPGMPNPRLVGMVFRQYSSPWEKIARDHIRDVWDAVKRFLERVLLELTTDSVCDALFKMWIDPTMEKALKLAYHKLDELLHVYGEFEPLTTNHYFTDTVQQFARERENALITRRLNELFENYETVKKHDLPAILRAVNERPNTDMDESAAEKTFDYMRAFYKTALKLLIDNVPNLVIEVALISPLPSILGPKQVLMMTAEQVSAITSESDDKKAMREGLSTKLEVFRAGADMCKEYSVRESALAHGTRETEGIPDNDEPEISIATEELPNERDSDGSISSRPSTAGVEEQEPWEFGPRTDRTPKRYIVPVSSSPENQEVVVIEEFVPDPQPVPDPPPTIAKNLKKKKAIYNWPPT